MHYCAHPRRDRFKPAALAVAALMAFAGAAQAQQNVVQPGDPIIASSSNSPGSEGVANAIDGKPTKYLNFDTRTGGKPSGFIVSPSVGVTRVTGVSFQSANDAPERDPKTVTIEGSNDDAVTAWDAGTWQQIARLDNIPAFSARFQTQTLSFSNNKPYKHYRVTVLETQTVNGCCFQIAEVGLLGSLLPQDVTQPGDPVIASSSNSPGSEGVANIIDGKPTKYLNFDTRTGGKPSGFIVSPSLGRTLITGVTIQSANDAPERDAKIVTIEGSNDATVTGWAEGNWELVQRLDNIPAFASRFETQTFLFDNYKSYRHYRFTVLETQTVNGCCFQAAEVELLGTGAPQDVTQPGDPIIASSSNSPGSEGVANIIDGKPTKYLNFDTRTGGKPSGFIVTPSIGATTVIGMTMQSANDAPERDPKIVTLEGSNDDAVTGWAEGNWELVQRLDNIPAFASRFETQEFAFPNAKSYKHYRFTVLETQTVNGCCFQMAEVELLAVSQGVDCNKARFLVQPENTPVLDGATATFYTTVNGPWPLQWLKNGEPISGANAVTYTTPPVTAANASDVYSVQIKGCEVSSPVTASIFKPSATKSVGISFRGGGANGAPTLMNPTDIAGIVPQAYWVNAPGAGSGDLPDLVSDPAIPLVDSDNNETALSFNYQTSGSWGSGTGDASATGRMLNGLVQQNPGTPGSMTFWNVPAGKHTVIAYLVGIPLQFQDADYTIVGKNTETYYVRVVNADEYNAAPGFYRGISKDPAKRSLATYVRFDNVEAAADSSIVLNWTTITTGFDRGAPVNAIQLVLNSTAAPAPPSITVQPQPTVAPEAGVATVSVEATGDGLTYQWRKNGRNLPDGGNISGARSAKLTIKAFSADDEAIYSVAIFNAGGSVVSGNASVRVSKYSITDQLVGHWKFDETSGNTAANAAAGGKPAAVKGTSSWGAGQVGNAFGFDGATYLLVDSFTAGKKQISASAWVNLPAGTATTMPFLRNAQGALGLGAGVGPGTPAGQFEFGIVGDVNTGEVRAQAVIGAGPNLLRATAPLVFPSGWHHVLFSADGAQLRLYIDGVQVASTDYISALNVPDVPFLSFGAWLDKEAETGNIIPDLNDPRFMAGQIDDVGLWTRGLSGEEVSKIYAAGKAKQSLSTVTLSPPANQPGTLSVKLANGNVTVTWDVGVLQTAPSAAGPWTDAPGNGTITEAATEAAKFYRTVGQ